ncbi:hypothetical protein CLF_110581, partial [Clonorchis sinensis]
MGLIDNVWNMYPFNANQLNGDWILAFNGESLEGKQGEMSIDDFLMTTLRDSTKVDPAFPFSLAEVQPDSVDRHKTCGINFVRPEGSVEKDITSSVFVVHVATGYTLTAGFDGSTFCRQLKSAFTSQSPWFGKHLLYCRGLKGLNYDPTVLAEIHLDAEHFGYTKLIPAGCLPKLQSRVTAILRGAANELGQDWKHLTVKAFPQDEPMTKVTNKQLPEGTINPICFTVGEKADLVTRITGHILPDVGLHAELQLPDPENGHKMFKHILDEEFHHTAKGDSPYRTTELLSYNKTDGSFVYQMAYPCSSDPNDCIQPLKVMIKSSEILAADNTESFDKVCRVWSNDIDELVVYLTVSKEETTVGYDAVES